MSVRVSSQWPLTTTSGLQQKTITRSVVTPPPVWVRDPSWPPCDANPGDQKMVLLNAVFNGRVPTATNFLALSASGGNYTVDFGDGTVTNYAAGVIAEYAYSFDNPALAGTNAPVTLTASTDTVNRTAHGYTDGMFVTLYDVTSTPEVISGRIYYVINATANTFQISVTSGGSPVLFSVDGAATLLPYKIATVTVTPQAGQSITDIILDRRHSSVPNSYATNILDVCIAFSTLVSINTGSSGFVRHRSIERFRVLQMTSSGTVDLSSLCIEMSQLQSVTIAPTNISNAASMFQNCVSLRYAPTLSLQSVGMASSMFSGCRALYSAPSYNMPSCSTFANMFNACVSLQDVGALAGDSGGVSAQGMFAGCSSLVTAPPIAGTLNNVSSMFSSCISLKNVPTYNTASVTAFGSMFQGCAALETVPLFNTQSANSMNSMFSGCRALASVPRFNTQSVVTMSSMFATCTSLRSVPLFNTQNVTDMSSMFSSCSVLRTVPLFNTQSVSTMASMFLSCSSLAEVPLFNTPLVTNMNSMFSNCGALYSVPRFNTSRNVNMASMFNGCAALETAPPLDTSLSTNVTSMFNACTTLNKVPAYDFSSAPSLFNVFNGCTGLVVAPGFTVGATALTIAIGTFQGCTALSQVGPTNLNGVTSATNMNSIFQTCSSMARMQCFGMRFSFSVTTCVLSKGALEEIFENLASVSASQTITVTNNFGVGSTITSSTCTSTAGSPVITTVNTGGVLAGMLATGNQTALTTAVTATADPATDTFTLVAHGLTNGKKMSFSTVGTITGLSTFVPYYIVNATADTFQVASTVGGAPINLTGTSGSVTFRYPAYVVSVNPGVSITLDAPQAASGTSTSVFRTLDITTANLKNWFVSA